MKTISTLFYNNFFISVLAAQKAAWKVQQSARSNSLSELKEKFINGGGGSTWIY